MQSQSSKYYSPFDQPEIIRFLFHPRKDTGAYEKTSALAMDIPVDDNVTIGAQMHISSPSSPTILFFHGNGEIVSDYGDLGPVYNQNGINFLVVDYRGYGRSTGSPTVSNMMNDAHAILKYARQWLTKENFSGPLIVMGRSLGSASALELAANCSDGFDGLIIESGFAYAIPLLNLLGANTDVLNIREKNEFDNIHKIKHFSKPTLVIHAEFDHIIPYTDGKALFDASPAPEKKLLKIPQADHNTIFSYGMNAYMNAVKDMVSSML
ncbi:MAG: lysophospholipase [Proteobacteria bacterium]|nr:lysophospholipase [Pseudomonadota bacterium]